MYRLDENLLHLILLLDCKGCKLCRAKEISNENRSCPFFECKWNWGNLGIHCISDDILAGKVPSSEMRRKIEHYLLRITLENPDFVNYLISEYKEIVHCDSLGEFGGIERFKECVITHYDFYNLLRIVYAKTGKIK